MTSGARNGPDCVSRPDHIHRLYSPRITREKLDEAHKRNAELEALNERLSKQLIGYSNRVNEAMRPYLAKAWYEGRNAGWRPGSLGHKMHCRSVGPCPYEDHEQEGN